MRSIYAFRSLDLLIITLGHVCCACRKSEVNVIDAKTMSSDPVAAVELPNRVPYGFHAFFVNEVRCCICCFSAILFCDRKLYFLYGNQLH
jgi:hypothetical protein